MIATDNPLGVALSLAIVLAAIYAAGVIPTALARRRCRRRHPATGAHR